MGDLDIQLTLSSPIIVAEGPPEVHAWGYYQFPKLARMPDGRIILSFQMAPDSALSYGNGGALHYLSSDEGQSWLPAQIEFEEVAELSLFQRGLHLANGDVLNLRTEKAPRATDLTLPTPYTLAYFSYDNTRSPKPLFRWEELPEELQGIPISRFRKKEGVWEHGRGKVQAPDDLRAPIEGVLPVIFFGDMRRAKDGSILVGVYPNYCLRENGSVETKCSVAFYRTEDEGAHWTLQGRLFYRPDVEYDELAEIRRGFTETSFDVLEDGSLLAIMRTTDASPRPAPLYQSRSLDMGKTWSKPQVISPFGVEPCLARLGNGMLAVSYGRPGVQVRLSPDGQGETWCAPRDVVPAAHTDPRGDSCGYSSLLPLGEDEILVAYSLFRHTGRGGKTVKAIGVRRLKVKRYQKPEAPVVEKADDALRHYQNGKSKILDSEIPLKNRLVTGIGRQCFSNGQTAVETSFLEGRAHGPQRHYHRDGTLMKEVTFVNDHKEGPERVYDRLGNILSERFFDGHCPIPFEDWEAKPRSKSGSGA